MQGLILLSRIKSTIMVAFWYHFIIFARAVIKQERIPFDVESENQAKLQRAWEAMERMRASAVANGVADMPMEEIDEEIRAARRCKHNKI